MASISPYFSAANAVIEVAGREIGRMQSFEASIDYGVQEIKNLWQPEIQSYARGIQRIVITAKRAVVDVETMFGDTDTIFDLVEKFDELTDWLPDTTQPWGIGQLIKQSSIDVSKDFAATALQLLGSGLSLNVNAAPGIKNLQNLLNEIKSGAASISDFFSRIPFDIVVKSSALKTHSTDISDFFASPQAIWKFSDCRVSARSFSLDISNVIVMENITTYARKFSEPALTNKSLSR